MMPSKFIRLAVGLGALLIVGLVTWLTFREPSLRRPSLEVSEEGLTQSSVEQLLQYIESSSSKAILLNVWASWCAPCQEEIPMLLDFERDYGGLGFELLFYSADNLSDLEEVQQVMTQLQMKKSFFRGKSPMADLEQLYPGWSGALPISILYDKTRKPIRRWLGTASEAEFREDIEAVLGLNEENE